MIGKFRYSFQINGEKNHISLELPIDNKPQKLLITFFDLKEYRKNFVYNTTLNFLLPELTTCSKCHKPIGVWVYDGWDTLETWKLKTELTDLFYFDSCTETKWLVHESKYENYFAQKIIVPNCTGTIFCDCN